MTTVSKSFTMPKTVEEISARLATLDQLVIAREWERAAIVYAFTTATKGRPKKGEPEDGRMPIKKFAALSIRGLSSHVTVGHYRRAWSDAIEAGKANEPVPGKSVAIPQGIEFPKMHAAESVAASAAPPAEPETKKYTKEELHELIMADEDPGFTTELRDTMTEHDTAKRAGAIRKEPTGSKSRRTSTGERLEAVPSGRELSKEESARKSRERRSAKGSSGAASGSKEVAGSDDTKEKFSSLCGQLSAVLDALLDTLDPGELSASVRAAYVAELQEVETRAAAIRERLQSPAAGKGGKRRAS